MTKRFFCCESGLNVSSSRASHETNWGAEKQTAGERVSRCFVRIHTRVCLFVCRDLCLSLHVKMERRVVFLLYSTVSTVSSTETCVRFFSLMLGEDVGWRPTAFPLFIYRKVFPCFDSFVCFLTDVLVPSFLLQHTTTKKKIIQHSKSKF